MFRGFFPVGLLADKWVLWDLEGGLQMDLWTSCHVWGKVLGTILENCWSEMLARGDLGHPCRDVTEQNNTNWVLAVGEQRGLLKSGEASYTSARHVAPSEDRLLVGRWRPWKFSHLQSHETISGVWGQPASSAGCVRLSKYTSKVKLS